MPPESSKVSDMWCVPIWKYSGMKLRKVDIGNLWEHCYKQ